MNNIPHNLEIEKACLSCALLNDMALKDIIASLTVEDFYNEKHRIIFQCIKEIKVTDYAAIKQHNPEITHHEYIELYEASASSAYVDYYITELKKLTNTRKVIKINQDSINKINQGYNIDEIILELKLELQNIEDINPLKVYSSQELYKDKILKDFVFNETDFVKTGIQDFDEKFWGLYKSELILITGRPATGKSALAMNIAMNHSHIEPVIYVSLEMPEKFFKVRMLARESMVNGLRIQHNWKMNLIDQEKIQDAINRLSERKLFVIDKSGLKKDTIDNKVRQFYDKNGLGLLVIDYLQIMGTSSNEQRYVRIGEDLLTLKNIGRDLNIPVIVISSKSRGSEQSKDLLSGFSESGKIEYEADKAIFLEYKDWEENISNESIQGKIVLAKNKNGAIGFAPITFYKSYSKFI